MTVSTAGSVTLLFFVLGIATFLLAFTEDYGFTNFFFPIKVFIRYRTRKQLQSGLSHQAKQQTIHRAVAKFKAQSGRFLIRSGIISFGLAGIFCVLTLLASIFTG